MTQAVNVIRDGHAFQARQFWMYAARLLSPISPIVRLGFESGPKAFDDLWVEYAPGRGPRAADGIPLEREHFQCKWHVASASYGYADLIQPAFLGATAASLLERAHDAHGRSAGQVVRYSLVTNWHPAKGDPLCDLINTATTALRLPVLFGTQRDSSRMGKVRKAWREHLAIDDAALGVLAGRLGFVHWSLSPEQDRLWLSDAFQVAGLRPVAAGDSSFPHEDIVFRWMAQQRQVFDAKALREACQTEGLLDHAKPRPVAVGIKSFEHAFDRLEDRCTDVLNLVPAFHDRFIQDPADWSTTLYPQLHRFLTESADASTHLSLALDAHASLAFAAGSVLDVKAGRDVALEQRSPAREVWHANEPAVEATWPTLETRVVEREATGNDLAVAVGLTHDNAADVQAYVDANLPGVRDVLFCRPSTGAGQSSVFNGAHAAMLADALATAIRQTRRPGVSRRVHLFIAAPNAFTFMAGQRQPGMGTTTLYEFDFGAERTGSYEPSLMLPPTTGGPVKGPAPS